MPSTGVQTRSTFSVSFKLSLRFAILAWLFERDRACSRSVCFLHTTRAPGRRRQRSHCRSAAPSQASPPYRTDGAKATSAGPSI
eukprot:763751-Hanusia_phi.AAC.2